MTTIRVTNWDKWQSYRRDRGAPPWIKVYRNLMSNAEWASLSDAEKGQLVSIWLVAADKGGEVPADPAILRKVCQLDEPPNINKFAELGFMSPSGCQDGAKVTTSRRQGDAPETETETETERAIVVSNGNDPTPDLSPIPKSLRRKPNGEIQKMFDNYNIAAAEFGLSIAEKLTRDRERKLEARRKEHGVEGWNRALANIENTPFLRGENDRGWRADLDFLLQPKSLNKVIEGGYEISRQADGGGGRATKDERGKAALLRGLKAKLPEPPR